MSAARQAKVASPPNLTVHRNTQERRERHAAYGALAKAVKRHSSAKDYDGWGLVIYRREGREQVVTAAEFFVRDPMDVYHLPDMARHALSEAIK